MNNHHLDLFSLFSGAEGSPAKPASVKKNVSITKQNSTERLSKPQKQFNSLIKKIDAQKTLLLNWQEALPRYHLEVSQSYTPLHEKYNDLKVELVLLFDNVIRQ